jgi:pimeloyl-ACP methyl ester carboxylesterase
MTLLDTPLGRLNVKDTGTQTHAPALLLTHAFAGSHHAWDPLIDKLSRTRRVIAVDLLGHGESDKPKRGYTMPDQAHAVCAVLDQLDVDQVVGVGHSGGGDVIVAMIEHHPQRLSGAVLLGTPPNLTYVELPIAARALSAPLLGTLIWKLLTDNTIKNSLTKTFAPHFTPTEEIYATLIADLRHMTHHSYIHARRHVERYRKQEDLTRRTTQSKIPLLIIFGDQDQWVQPQAATHWAQTTDAHIQLLAGVGHTPMTEAPGATAELIINFAHTPQLVE